MAGKRLLVVGIDPGTTTAYAVLDIEGNLLHIKSQKEFGLNSLISEATSLGKVVLAGTDKQKVPGFIEAFSAKTGARILCPAQDLKVQEKRELIKDYKTENWHQSDALAAALYTFRKIKPLMEKIDFIVKEKNKFGIRNEIKELVLLKNLSIYMAIKLLEAPKEEDIIMEKVMERRELKEEDFKRIYEKLKIAHKDNLRLRQYTESLSQKLLNFEKQIESHKNENENLFNSKVESLFSFKERRLKNYAKIIKEKNSTISYLRQDVRRIENILANINNLYILKKLDNLGSSHFEIKKVLLNISKGDMLFVDDPNIISKSTAGDLIDKISVIVHKKPVSRKIASSLPFIFISSNNLPVEDLGNLAVVEKKILDEEKNKKEIMFKIVEDYKRERINLV